MTKILALNGSPRKAGVTAQLIEEIKLNSKNIEFELVNLYDNNIHGCKACEYCHSENAKDYCITKDDMIDLYKKVEGADCIIFGSPIYFGTITGVAKIFIDRLYSFMKKDYKFPDLNCKKIVTISVSGAKEENYCIPTSNYYKDWFGDFFGMEIIEQINIGNLMADKEVLKKDNPKMLEAKKIGMSLNK